ncbi:hypothetical protein DV738_g4250, partial [Chaetothyriales sp. CBS 135597]
MAALNASSSSSPFVTLVSADGFEFHIRRSAVCISGTIRRMLESGMGESKTGVCHLENISGIVLEKVVEYLYYNEQHKDSTGVPDMEIPSELCLELLMAADFLDT